MNHQHQCGFGDDGFEPETGCGHIWEHEDSMILAPKDVFKEAHMCPACGKGPWSIHYCPEGTTADREAELLLGIMKLIIARIDRKNLL